uniref:Invertebrate defensins family profile domain-containing protein n=1 Tax=Isometrus maculatus TaxID=497827 RepID=A0A0U1S639_ISOMC|nr:hypothetical protein [Isometrus maculatus]
MNRVKLFIIMISVLTLTMCDASRKVRSSLNCKDLCMKTGYHGKIGNCKCGFTIFTKRIYEDEETSPIFPSSYSSPSSHDRVYEKIIERNLKTLLKFNPAFSNYK